ncbi:MAG: hypothetical protein AAFY10_04090 [Pseudomonadota bacterium]
MHPAPSPRGEALRDIEQALERLETGEFGYCESCNGKIELERLCEDPTVSMCRKCSE